jgi:hypothetical protein
MAFISASSIWTEGRLEELRRAGLMFKNEPPLTAKEWKAYQELKQAGYFEPQREHVLSHLCALELVAPEDIDKVTDLIMNWDKP